MNATPCFGVSMISDPSVDFNITLQYFFTFYILISYEFHILLEEIKVFGRTLFTNVIIVIVHESKMN